MKKPLVVVVVGPTASGKTSLAIDIAKKYNGEIISADSMQIYKKMNIATAKPTEDELSQVKHHMISIIDADEEFSVAMYKAKAVEIIKEILDRGKLPIVAGGTGLYIDTLINNTTFLDYGKTDIREKLEEEAEEKGIESLYEKLREIDPETHSRLHINDRKRIIRALELYYATGRTISEQDELSHLNESEFNWCIIGLNAENRQILYDRINLRVDIMLEEGLIKEAEEFFSSDISKTANQAIGYKELKPYLDGLVSLETAIDKLKMETRRYAKRQLTWFRRNEKINWINIDCIGDEPLILKASEIIDIHSGD